MTDTTTKETPAQPPLLVIPKDESKSRLASREAAVAAADAETAADDFVRAEDRFNRFRIRFKDGSHDAELVNVIQHPDGHVTYVVKAFAWKAKRLSDSIPDATALVARSTRDADAITAANPLATADTVARSRALRNLGVLAKKPKPKVKPDA